MLHDTSGQSPQCLMTDLGLIQASEDPQRDSVAIPHFLIVDGQITVGQVGGLVEGFLCAAYSNKYLLLDKESPAWAWTTMSRHPLGRQKSFALGPFGNAAA